jgi:CTP:molybdopterin cytidylyltransferase MocA
MSVLDRFGCIILAAGRGSRISGPKALLDYKGSPWLFEQLRRVSTCGIRSCKAVVTAELVPALGAVSASLIVNPRTDDPYPFSSIQVGVAEMADGLEGLFVLPVDVPAAGAEVWLKMAVALEGSVQVVHPVRGGHAGHPVLLSRRFARAMLEIDASSSEWARLDAQVRRLEPKELARIEVIEDNPFMNINERNDWDMFLKAEARCAPSRRA